MALGILINVPFAIIAVVAGLFLLPESKLSKEKSHSWDIPSTILSIAGMIGLVWSIKEFSKEGLADIIPWVVIVLAITMIVIFVKRNLSSSDPMLDVRLFKRDHFQVQFCIYDNVCNGICFVISFTMVTGCGRTFSF